MRTLSIAALQCAPVARDPAATLERFRRAAGGGHGDGPRRRSGARPRAASLRPARACSRSSPATPTRWRCRSPAPLTDALSALAAEHRVWLVPGTVFERAADGRIHNTALAFSPEGELVARYRKVFPWQPHEECAPGDRFVTFDIPDVGRIGLAICYDGNFPEAFRQLAWMGAEVVLQPTLTTTSDRAAELVLARANAIVNQLYVVNLNASDPAGLGRSLAAGEPLGRDVRERSRHVSRLGECLGVAGPRLSRSS